jgi:phosphoribosyl 1,2-cyclic phosphodiesterase
VLRFKSLGSGSTGNATLIEATGLHSRRLLVDCGLGIRQLSVRLAEAGLAETDIDAIFITHEHSDHIGCARQLALRHRIPVWMSRGTCEGVGLTDLDGLLHIARDGQAIDLGELELMPFTVPHDAREPLQLTCTDGASKLGVLTDLGHATTHLLDHLVNCNALLLECNHRPAGPVELPAIPQTTCWRAIWAFVQRRRRRDCSRSGARWPQAAGCSPSEPAEQPT